MTKGRLFGSRTYLCGSMDKASDGGVGWRNSIKPFLADLGIVVIDPCDKPTKHGAEGAEEKNTCETLKQQGKYDELAKVVNEFRCIDLRSVDIVDFIIVNFDLDVLMVGTMEEVFLSNREKKPVLIHCPQGKQNMPNWMFGTLPHQLFFDNWTDLRSYINYVNSSPEKIETYNRWMFFDYNQLIPQEAFDKDEIWR